MNSFTTRTLLFFCLVFFLVAIIFLTVSEKKRLAREDKKHKAKIIEHGAALYGQHCSSCHGTKGEGLGQLGPPLNDAHFFTKRTSEVGWLGTLDEYISSTISYGRMMATRPMYAGNGTTYVMPPWGSTNGGLLQPADMDALTMYTLNWKPTALGKVQLEELPLPTFTANTPENIEKGRQVFTKHCAQCHGFQSVAPLSTSAPDLSFIAHNAASRKVELDDKEYIRESILIPTAHLAEGFTTTDCAAVLTMSELDAVTVFLLQAQ